MTNWLNQIEYWRAGQTRGFVLGGNTADKQYDPEVAAMPMPLKYFLACHLAKEGYVTGHYTLGGSFEEVVLPKELRSTPRPSPFASLPNDARPEAMLQAFTKILRNPDSRVCLILDYADHIAPASSGMTAMFGQAQLAMLELLHAWGKEDAIRRSPNLIMLVTYSSPVNELLLNSGEGYRQIELPLPAEGARREFIELCVRRDESVSKNWGIEPAGLARATSGLPLAAIDELFKLACQSGKPLDYTMVRRMKANTIRQLCGNLIEVVDTDAGFEAVQGLEHAKDELGRIAYSFEHSPETAPQGVLLAGVPGCGKSFIVKALSHHLGIPCLAMRNIREGLVGASERNLERVLWVVSTLSPCVLWIDEIDQIMGQRNTGQSMDAGTSERMMARIFEFFGSLQHRGRVLVVGTSNRPDILDAALLDRFQVVIPFLHPSPTEVEGLIPALAGQVGRKVDSEEGIVGLGQLPSLRMPTVRALQEIVARAGTLADMDTAISGSPVGRVHLQEAAEDFQPNYNPLEHEFIALKAIAMTSFASVLPWRCRTGMREGVAIPDVALAIVDENGKVDLRKLYQRIGEVSALLRQERDSRSM